MPRLRGKRDLSSGADGRRRGERGGVGEEGGRGGVGEEGEEGGRREEGTREGDKGIGEDYLTGTTATPKASINVYMIEYVEFHHVKIRN